MQNTKNFNLKKPELSDHIHVSDINDNMDTLDAVIKDQADQQALNTSKYASAISSGESFVGFGYEPLGGVIRIDDDDPRIKYSEGDWKRFSGSDVSTREGLAFTYHDSQVVGATLSFNFIGTGIYAGIIRDKDFGRMSVSIDDGTPVVVDLYKTVTNRAYGEPVPLASGLNFGVHSVLITVLEKNPLSLSGIVRLFYFDIITTTDSNIKLSYDRLIGKSSAITEGVRTESLTDISHTIPEITQLIPNASFKRMAPTWGTVFQDDFNRADGVAGNGWNGGNIVSNKLVTQSASNGSSNWTDRQIRFSFVAIAGQTCLPYIKYSSGGNFVYAYISIAGASISVTKRINGVDTQGSPVTFSQTAGTTYYVTLRAIGNIYSASITANPDYVTGAVTACVYCDNLPSGNFTFVGTTDYTYDNVVVTAPVPYGYFARTEVGGQAGNLTSFIGNSVALTNNLNVINYVAPQQDAYIPVTVGQTYTFKMKRKILSYTSGDGNYLRVAFFQSDKTTQINAINSTFVTSIDADFVEVSLSTGVIPANTAYVYFAPRTDGLTSCQWKEPLFELTSTATGVFHEKESRCDLAWLKTDGTTGITLGTGKDELAYRVEANGNISKFFGYRNKINTPYWERAKTWYGGTGWYVTSGLYATNISGDTFYVSFVGTGADLISQLNPYRGLIGVTIDGGTEFFINGYDPASAVDKTIPLVRGLSYGHHQIKLRCTGINVMGAQNYITLYGFNIYVPAIPDTPAKCQPLGAITKADPDDGWIRYEENEGVVYSGIWVDESGPIYSGGTDKGNENNNTTDYAEFSAVCTGIRYIAQKSYMSGIVSIFINDVNVGNVDCYNTGSTPQSILYSNNSLTLGLNKIKVLCTNTKNSSSTGSLAKVDAFEVKQPLYVVDLRKTLQEDKVDRKILEVVGDLNLSNIPASFPMKVQDQLNYLKSQIDTKLNKQDTAYIYVSPTGSDLNPGTSVQPLRHINTAINMCGKYLNGEIRIRILPGDYSDEGVIHVQGFTGLGDLVLAAYDGNVETIAASDSYKISRLVVTGNSCNSVAARGLCITYTGSSGPSIYIATNSSTVYFYYIRDIIASARTGIHFDSARQGHVQYCEISNKGNAMVVASTPIVTSQDWASTSGNSYGLNSCYGSKIVKIGVQPVATTAETTSLGGTIV